MKKRIVLIVIIIAIIVMLCYACKLAYTPQPI